MLIRLVGLGLVEVRVWFVGMKRSRSGIEGMELGTSAWFADRLADWVHTSS